MPGLAWGLVRLRGLAARLWPGSVARPWGPGALGWVCFLFLSWGGSLSENTVGEEGEALFLSFLRLGWALRPAVSPRAQGCSRAEPLAPCACGAGVSAGCWAPGPACTARSQNCFPSKRPAAAPQPSPSGRPRVPVAWRRLRGGGTPRVHVSGTPPQGDGEARCRPRAVLGVLRVPVSLSWSRPVPEVAVSWAPSGHGAHGSGLGSQGGSRDGHWGGSLWSRYQRRDAPGGSWVSSSL